MAWQAMFPDDPRATTLSTELLTRACCHEAFRQRFTVYGSWACDNFEVGDMYVHDAHLCVSGSACNEHHYHFNEGDPTAVDDAALATAAVDALALSPTTVSTCA